MSKHKMRLTRGILVLIVVLLIPIINSLAKSEPKRNKPMPGSVAILVADKNGKAIKQIRLAEPGIVEGILYLRNDLQQMHEYGLILIVNGKQTPFKLDKKLKSFHVVSINKNDRKKINFELPLSTKDFYSVVFLAIVEPNKISQDPERIIKTYGMQRISYRIDVKVGVNKDNVNHVPREVPKIQLPVVYPRLHGLLISEEPTIPKLWFGDSWYFGNKEFYIHIGNQRSTNDDYAIISLLNWNQIPISSQLPFAYIRLEPKQKFTIKASMEIPFIVKKRNLVFIAIRRPYSIFYAPENPDYTGAIEDSHRIVLSSQNIAYVICIILLILSVVALFLMRDLLYSRLIGRKRDAKN